MRIDLCKFNYDNIRYKATSIWFGTLLLIFGIQSICDLYNDKIMSINHVKEYGSLMIIIGFLFICYGIININFRRNSYRLFNEYDYDTEFL